MVEAGAILQGILRQGWTVMAAFLAVIALLGGLAQVFKFTGGLFLGSGLWVSEAVAAVLGVVVIALFGFLAIPVLARSAFVAANVGCGPVIEIGQFSALLIGGIGSLRMLKGILQAVVSASLGATTSTLAPESSAFCTRRLTASAMGSGLPPQNGHFPTGSALTYPHPPHK